eukprot:3144774-Alexandrium_andersonii.AAC.1
MPEASARPMADRSSSSAGLAAASHPRPGRDRSRGLPRTPDGVRRGPEPTPATPAVPSPRPPLQTTLHRWGLWCGNTNAYDLRRARQLQEHLAAGGQVSAHALGDVLQGRQPGGAFRLQGLPP